MVSKALDVRSAFRATINIQAVSCNMSLSGGLDDISGLLSYSIHSRHRVTRW